MGADQMQQDDPAADATDAAHPAWWRGCDHGVEVTCLILERLLDGTTGKEPPEFGSAALTKLAHRLLELAQRNAAQSDYALCKHCGQLQMHHGQIDGKSAICPEGFELLSTAHGTA